MYNFFVLSTGRTQGEKSEGRERKKNLGMDH